MWSGVLAASAIALPLGSSGAQDVAYTLTPSLTYVDWNEDLGLEQAYLYGGRFGLDFGRYISLRGFYLTRSGVETRLGELTLRDTLGQPLPEQEVDVTNYGGSIVAAFSTGDVVPIATGGGSVIEFDPDRRDRSRQIGLSYGGGLRFGRPDRTQVELLAKIWRFRLNRFRLAPDTAAIPMDTADPAGDRLWRNISVSLGVNIPFGERRFMDQPPELRWSRASFPIEVFGGRLDFDSEAGLAEQELLGVRAGVDFGRLVGVRGYYWRGTNDDFDDFQDIESWGGEAQFALNAGSGIAPFLVFGAGQLNFKDDYRDIAGNARDDRTMIILGGGVKLGITDRIRLHVGARDHIFSAGELEDVAGADELQHNWMYSAGLLFGIGGGYRAQVEREQAEARERERTEAERQAREALAEERRQLEMEREALEAERARMAGQPAPAVAPRQPAPGAAPRQPARTVREIDTVVVERRQPGAVSDRTVALPVPERGELHVRYGADDPRAAGAPMQPGMMGAEGAALREAIRAIAREELDRSVMMMRMGVPGAAPGAPAAGGGVVMLDSARMEIISQRVASLLQRQQRMERDSIIAEMRRQLAAEQAPAEAQQALLDRIDAIVAAAVAREFDRRAREGQPVAPGVAAQPGEPAAEPEQPSPRLTPRAWYAYSGVGWDGTTQMLLGLRSDLGGPFARYPDIHLVPELALGVFGSNTSWLLAGNLQYGFPQFSFGGDLDIRPFVGAGLGLLNFKDEVGTREGFEAVLNLGYGARFPLRVFGLSPNRPIDAFIEHQGVDVFSLNRLLVGVRAQF